MIAPREVDYSAVASAGQARLWIVDQLVGGGVGFVPFAARITGPLDVRALNDALNRVVGRHEVLRTTYRMEGDSLLQDVHLWSPRRFLAAQDLALAADAGQSRPSVDALIAALAAEPLDLGRDLPLRAALHRVAPDEHVLTMLLHHICVDGQSMGVLLEDLAAEYGRATSNGAFPRPGEPSIQYADFATAEEEFLDGPEGATLRDFWRTTLTDLPDAVVLGTAKTVGAGSAEGAVRRSHLASETMAAVRHAAAANGTTPFMVLFTAFADMIRDRVRRDDVVLGLAATLRPEGANDAVGFFVNTLPVRVRASRRANVRARLQNVVAATLDALDHRALPFDQILAVAPTARRSAGSPLVQAMFAYDKGRPTLSLRGLQTVVLPVHTGASRLDLTVTVTEIDGAADVMFEYARDRVSDQIVRDIANEFQAAVLALVETPVHEERQSRRPPLPHQSLAAQSDGFLSQVARVIDRTPDHPAVACADVTLSYEQFGALAGSVATSLEQIVSRGSVLGLLVDRSATLPSILTGMLAAGCAYLPLDPALPESRLRFMVSDSEAAAVIHDGRHADLASRLRCRTVDVADLEGPRLERGGFLARCVATHPELVAYVLYTSGSTGTPKGVAVPHSALRVFANGIVEHIDLDPPGRWLAATAVTFDISVLELLWPLAHGFTIVVRPGAVREGSSVLADILRYDITHFGCTPSLLRSLVCTEGDRAAIARLRTLVIGGEAPPVGFVHELAELTRVVNAYGPTETTVYCSGSRVMPGVPLTVGRPFTDVAMRVVDERGREVPDGVEGEIQIGGPILARGYVQRPGLTARQFRPDPCGSGGRTYASGDIGVRLADGTFQIRGRVDNQVKVRGQRVELEEVEAHLAAHRSVAACVAGLRDGVLIAHVVLRDASADVSAIRHDLRGTTPEVMIPSLLVPVASLPLTERGKVDRRTVASWLLADVVDRPSHATVVATEPYVDDVVTLWREVLETTPDADTDFFDSGGHSLAAIRLIQAINQRFGIELPLHTVYDAPTPRALAAAVERSRRDTA